MSANNVLVIRRLGDKLYAWDECADELMPEAEAKRGTLEVRPVIEADTLDQIVYMAEKYCSENIVEYGIHIDHSVTVPVLPVNTAKKPVDNLGMV